MTEIPHFSSFKEILNIFTNYISKQCIEDFYQKNQNSDKLKQELKLLKDYIFISNEELNNIYQEKNRWKIFYKKYQNSSGIITLSKITFNKSKRKAIVYHGNRRSGRGGIGIIYILEQKNNKWQVIYEEAVWKS